MLDGSSSDRDATFGRRRSRWQIRTSQKDYVNNSLGPIGHVAPVASDRLKGFLTDVITPELCGDLQEFLTRLRSEIYRPEHRDRFTAFNVRFVLTRGAIRSLRTPEFAEAGRYVEVIVPMDDGRFTVYFGHNKDFRTNTAAELLQAWANVRRADEHVRTVRKDVLEMRRDANKVGYAISALDARGIESNYQQLARMLKGFKYAAEDIDNLLHSRNNEVRVSVVRKGRRIVSIAVSETADITLRENGSEWNQRITEITDAVTMDGHHGHNLYLLASSSLLVHLESRPETRGGLKIAEYNLDEPAVLVSALRQGWKILDEAGLGPGFSMLPKHSTINGKLRNLVVSFISDDALADHIALLKGARR